MADVGGIIGRLASLTEERVKDECNLWSNSKTEAEILLSNLKEIQDVMEEAEKRRLADPRIRTWLERLRDVTYEIDDALDDWEATNRQLRIHDNNWWKKMMNIFIRPFRSCINYISGGRGVSLHIKKLNEEVDSLRKETNKYNMLPIISASQDVTYEITTCFSDLIEIPGQQIYKEILVHALLDTDSGERDDINVISLVGMAGIGKTTVAQLAFNDPRVQPHFDLISWICASHISDMIRLTKAMLQSLHVSYPEDAELQTLLKRIRDAVSGKRFLLVLDHVQREDDSVWNVLKTSLLRCASGSRILVTTRNKQFAKLLGSTQYIRRLSDKDCWLLFSKIAFHRRGQEINRFGDIGRGIAKKCKGLPHAAKTLGKYLQQIISKELWDDVLEKELWQLDEVAEALFAPFAFSYNELPLALKHCFSYCAFYPEDIPIYVDDLVRLWMVQGYLSSSVADTETELKGRDYFEKLVRRSFFQAIEMDDLGEKIITCKMHPVLLNFARYLAKTGSKREGLRSFYGELPPTKLDSLKSVRVLLVKKSKTQDLPKEIGKLVRLRYMNLASNPIKRLPVTICDLYNLYCLDLRNCTELSELPEQIHRLKNLKHLLVDGSGIQRLPQGLGKLTDLQTLDAFRVGRMASKFGYLDKLDQLRGSMNIHILDLREEEDIEDAKKADLSSKNYVSDLRLFFRGESSMDVLDHLRMPPNLHQFHVSGYQGTRFPSWISTFLNKLIVLKFEACAECSELPPVGKLPFLEMLIVRGMKSLKRVGREFLGDSSDQVIFPKLRELQFDDCPSWEKWEDITEDEANTLCIMPLLETLSFKECDTLRALPKLILHKATSLDMLVIYRHCHHLSERYRRDSPEWEPIIQNRQLQLTVWMFPVRVDSLDDLESFAQAEIFSLPEKR